MSEQQPDSLVEGKAREQLERELLGEYLDSCHFYAIISICSTGILPRFRELAVSLGDGSISRSDLIGRYKFTHDYSIIGTWNYKDFIQNMARYDYDKSKKIPWKEFLTIKISQYLKLTTLGDTVEPEILELLIDRVITTDPLYKFFYDPEGTHIKISQSSLKGNCSGPFQILVQSLAAEVAGHNLHEGFDPRIEFTKFAKLLLSGNLPANCSPENRELLKQLIQLLLSQTDIEYFSQGVES